MHAIFISVSLCNGCLVVRLVRRQSPLNYKLRYTTTTAAHTLELVDGIWSYNKEQVIASFRLQFPISIALYRIGLCYGGAVLWNGGGRAVIARLVHHLLVYFPKDY